MNSTKTKILEIENLHRVFEKNPKNAKIYLEKDEPKKKSQKSK